MTIDWNLVVNNNAIQKLVNRVKKQMYDAALSAAHEILDEMEQDLNRFYYDIIKDFYSDYSPVFYNRAESLYDLLVISNNQEGLTGGFDSDNATAFERGGGSDGLYEHVFRQGWHGGATGTDKHGMTVRVPSWREPFPWYSHWGKQAARARISPLDAWNESLETYKSSVLPRRYQALYRKHLQARGFK